MKVRLLTPYYQDKVKARQIELDTCLERNLANKLLDEVILLVDDNSIPKFKHAHLKVINTERRPYYSDFFTEANSRNSGDDISIIANTDMWMNPEAIKLIVASLKPEACYALSRWNALSNGEAVFCDHPEGSQDVWIFRGKIREMNSNFSLGIPGCDHVIAHAAKAAGYLIANPSRSIKTFHLHLTNVRNYRREKDKLPPPWLMLPPTFLHDSAANKPIGLPSKPTRPTVANVTHRIYRLPVHPKRRN